MLEEHHIDSGSGAHTGENRLRSGAQSPKRAQEQPAANPGARFSLTRLLTEQTVDDIAEDVRRGLTATPKELPPKYFYDERGSKLFDAICDTAEYYQTRTEKALLERYTGEILERTQPQEIVELGSGAARKTRVLLDHLVARFAATATATATANDDNNDDDASSQADAIVPLYMPVDISAEMLTNSAQALLRDYPTLRVHGVVADYEHHLHKLPADGHRLIVFLGSTIGNFQPDAAVPS